MRPYHCCFLVLACLLGAGCAQQSGPATVSTATLMNLELAKRDGMKLGGGRPPASLFSVSELDYDMLGMKGKAAWSSEMTLADFSSGASTFTCTVTRPEGGSGSPLLQALASGGLAPDHGSTYRVRTDARGRTLEDSRSGAAIVNFAFPERQVKEGETWDGTVRQGSAELPAKFTLVRYEPIEDRVAAVIEYGFAGSSGSQFGGSVATEFKACDWIDVEHGTVWKSTQESTMGSGDMKISQKCTTLCSTLPLEMPKESSPRVRVTTR